MNVPADQPQANPQPAATGGHRPFRDRAHDAQFSAFNPRVKSPLIASFLSLFPGLGQIYVGYYAQGFTHAAVVAFLITIISMDMLGDAVPLAALFLPFFWLYNIVDAGRRAAFYNEAMQGEDVALLGDLPKFGTKSGTGSVGLGIGLLVVGSILLSRTAFNFSLQWVEDWWPVAPIAVGVWLCIRGLTDRKDG